MSVLCSGIYQITNVKYPNYAVELFCGNLRGAIIGNGVTGTHTQQWKVEMEYDSSNRFYLENMTTRGSYAGVYHGGANQLDAPLAGSPENDKLTLWAAELVSGTQDVYRITTVDGQYSWFLPAPYNYVTVVLRSYDPYTQPTDAHWKFELQEVVKSDEK